MGSLRFHATSVGKKYGFNCQYHGSLLLCGDDDGDEYSGRHALLGREEAADDPVVRRLLPIRGKSCLNTPMEKGDSSFLMTQFAVWRLAVFTCSTE